MALDLSRVAHPVKIQLTVQWGEMDSFQHVNNAVYFRYFETARIEYFKQTGIIAPQSSIGPILAKATCTFIFPLTYPDEVLCTATTTQVMTDRFFMEYHIYSLREQRIAAKGTGLIVSYDYSANCKVSLPESWKGNIAQLQLSTGVGIEVQ